MDEEVIGTRMPALHTGRLIIREFTLDDLDAIHQILDVDLHFTSGSEPAHTFEQRRAWLQWQVMSYRQLALLFQPPYGDRAVVLRNGGEIIGSCGFVQELKPFGQIPSFPGATGSRLSTAEVGLFYAFSPRHWRRGYAAEAARAMVEYGFGQLNLARIVATTDYDNAGSMGVMRRLGMRIERNPLPDPPWFQIVSVLENPASTTYVSC